jgi:hypothetical protein
MLGLVGPELRSFSSRVIKGAMIGAGARRRWRAVRPASRTAAQQRWHAFRLKGIRQNPALMNFVERQSCGRRKCCRISPFTGVIDPEGDAHLRRKRMQALFGPSLFESE